MGRVWEEGGRGGGVVGRVESGGGGRGRGWQGRRGLAVKPDPRPFEVNFSI